MNSLLSTLLKVKGHTASLVKTNAPVILTAIGVSGTISTAYLAGKASYEAAGIIRKVEMGEPVQEDFLDRLKLRVPHVWRLYVPAATTGAVTIGCIIFSARVSTRRTAAMAAAYSLSEKAFLEYKDKVSEVVGKNKEEKIKYDLAQDRVNASPPTKQLLILSGPGNVLCHDPYTGRYFHSDMESLRRAQNNVNEKVLAEGEASLEYFYSSFDTYCTEWAKSVGWANNKLLDITYTAILFEGTPVLSIDYNYMQPII